jgi:hypothetical protein
VKDSWIGDADKKMEEKGTKGSFGKATPSKIKAGRAAGGKMEKKAVFAENMKKIAEKHKGKKKGTAKKDRPMTYFGQHLSN